MSIVDIIREVVPEYVKNREKEEILRYLLREEKRKRKKKLNDLLFLSASALAFFPYCPVKAVLKNIDEEVNNFNYYLTNRILYSIELGYYKKPRSIEELLSIGEEITLNDINELIKKRENEIRELKRMGIEIIEIPVILRGDKVVVDKKLYEKSSEYRKLVNSLSRKIVDMNDYPLERGKIMEMEKGRKHIKFSWYLKMNDFVIIGAPDGITDNFVYEFKSTKNYHSLKFIERIARIQANIYALIFKRKFYRVHVYVTEEDESLTYQEKANKQQLI